MNSDRILAHQLLDFLKNKAYFIIIISAVIILFVTLLPFNFTFPDNFSWNYLVRNFNRQTNFTDVIANIILFFPLGLGLTALLTKSNCKFFLALIITLAIGFSLSLTVEFCQFFLVSRKPTFLDLLTNSLGSGVGSLAIYSIAIFEKPLSKFLSLFKFINNPYFRFKSSILFWLSYFFIVCFILISVEGSNQLNNWDSRFPLLIGNEATRDRPWLGQISDFCMTKNALPQQEIGQLLKTNKSCIILNNNSDSLIAAYFFNEAHRSYFDLTRNSPNLDNQKKARFPIAKKGIIINRNNWLKTTFPPLKLTKEIQNSSQFTLFTKIATASFQQEGPARIISLSQNHLWRNFTIAQSHDDLSIRIRMGLTGVNGKQPEIRVTNFFKDRELHQLAIAYDGLRLRVYLDNLESEKSLYLGSEAAFFWFLLPIINEKIYLNMNKDLLYKVIYYGLMFAPLGICLAIITNFLVIYFKYWVFWIFGGLILPPLAIEGIISSSSNRSWSWAYLSLGLTMLIVSFGVTKLWYKFSLLSKQSNNY